MSEYFVHKTSIISPEVKLSKGVEIGPNCVIEGNIEIGENTKIGPFCHITGNTKIGKNNKIYSHSVLGTAPQDLKYKGEPTKLIIGDNNTIREFVTINRGTMTGNQVTKIGNNNLIMAYSHIAHDCIIGNNVVLANAATLAGHVQIEDFAIIGGLTAFHQFTRMGQYAIVGGASAVAQDILPYGMAAGNRARHYGLNLVGLKRHNFSKESIKLIKKAFRIIFNPKIPNDEVIEHLKKLDENSEHILHLIEFLKNSNRGICRSIVDTHSREYI